MDYLSESALYSGSIVSMLSVFASLLFYLMLPIFLFLFALVLYYFTGNNKKADEFMPKLAAQSVRIFSYVWLLIISIGAFLGISQSLYYIFASILPASEFALSSGSETFTKGVVVTILMACFAVGAVFLNRYSVEASGVGGSISTKIFASIGLTIFSILFFISSITTLTNLVDFTSNTSVGIDSSSVSIMLSSLGLFVAYLVKVAQLLKAESK